MFNKFNFNDRMISRFGINSILLIVMLVIIGFGSYQLNNSISNWLNWFVFIAIAMFLIIIVDYYVSKWCIDAVKSPIKEASEYTNKASKAIEVASLKHESSINKQLNLIKETESMVDKLSVTSEETKHSAQRVADKSNQALQMSKKGQDSMNVNIRNMTTLKRKIETIAEQILELSEHTQQIGSIIGVVEDITEQTNMLALNAAVEAARAGEHGRGFAVVASEIRKLSDQCKQATTKITALIYDIQQATNSTVMATEEGTKEIETGVNLANQVANTINALRATMCETVEDVEGIVSASIEQFKYAHDVSVVMTSVNTGIKDAVDTIEKSRNAITVLERVSDSLQEIFKTNGDYKKS